VSTSPKSSYPGPSDSDGGAEASEAGSGFDNAETAVGGADAVPDDPDINIRQPDSVPGTGGGPGAGLDAPENNG
jgi:hypothetical protein